MERSRRLKQIADDARTATDSDLAGPWGLNIDGLVKALRKAAADIDKIIGEAL
jgi:hypothetical protein